MLALFTSRSIDDAYRRQTNGGHVVVLPNVELRFHVRSPGQVIADSFPHALDMFSVIFVLRQSIQPPYLTLRQVFFRVEVPILVVVAPYGEIITVEVAPQLSYGVMDGKGLPVVGRILALGWLEIT
jgi:hypothetical protein